VFAAIDGLMSGLPEAARLSIWAILAAALSMAAYRVLSPQAPLRRIKQRQAEVRRSLKDHDGTMAEAFPLLGESLRLAFSQLLRVLAPAAVAALPVVVLLLWLDMTYGYRFPEPGEEVAVATEPADVPARLDWAPGGHGWSVYLGHDGGGARVPLSAAVPVIHKKRWWNFLLGNPAGYLPDHAPAETATFDLPVREYLAIGPDWIRGWYVIFLGVLFVTSLAIKLRLRII